MLFLSLCFSLIKKESVINNFAEFCVSQPVSVPRLSRSRGDIGEERRVTRRIFAENAEYLGAGDKRQEIDVTMPLTTVSRTQNVTQSESSSVTHHNKITF